jgi:toxin ParE1/3/4
VRRVRFAADAARELAEASAHYETARSGYGTKLEAAVSHAVARIEEGPLAFPEVGDAVGFRSAKVFGFPYRLVYLVTEEEVRILAVAHGARAPGYWRK